MKNEPKVEYLGGGKKKETHPSYGVIGISRQSTMGKRLFGSSLAHRTVFNITIGTAVKYRDGHRDNIMINEPLIEVQLSTAQLMSFITNQNTMAGNPCTLTRINGEAVPPCPDVNKREEIENEFTDKVKEILERSRTILKETIELLNSPKPLKKSEQTQLLEKLELLQGSLESGIPFVQSQFNESVDNVEAELKTEIESFIEGKLRDCGLDQITTQQAISGFLPER